MKPKNLIEKFEKKIDKLEDQLDEAREIYKALKSQTKLKV